MDRRQMLRVLRRGAVLGPLVSIGGFVVSSKSAPSEADFLEAALPIFSHSSGIRAFRLQKPLYAESPDLTLQSLKELPESKEVDPNLKSFLVAKLSDRSSYIFGLEKPMPFYADYGLVFDGSGTPNHVCPVDAYTPQG